MVSGSLAHDDSYVVYGLKETYAQPGRYEAKIVLSPRYFKDSRDVQVAMTDSDGEPMKVELARWGRRIGFSFVVDSDVSDGVASVWLSGSFDQSRRFFWVIK